MSEKQALVNREAFVNAGLYDPLRHNTSADRIREELNCGEVYVIQLLRGDKPLSGKIRAKLDALIAAKANDSLVHRTIGLQAIIDEADDSIEPSREQVEVDLPAESLLDQLVRKSTDLEAKLANQVDPRTYKVFTDPDGRAVVTKVIARITSIRDADEYVLFLNEQIRRGKESD